MKVSMKSFWETYLQVFTIWECENKHFLIQVPYEDGEDGINENSIKWKATTT